jgi:hypothetical protein
VAVRGLGISSLNLIHFSNKRRIEEQMYRRLLDIKSQTNNLELHLFPVNLAELSSRAAEEIDGGDRIFELLREHARVNFVLSERDDRLLAEAARYSSPVRGGTGRGSSTTTRATGASERTSRSVPTR